MEEHNSAAPGAAGEPSSRQAALYGCHWKAVTGWAPEPCSRSTCTGEKKVTQSRHSQSEWQLNDGAEKHQLQHLGREGTGGFGELVGKGGGGRAEGDDMKPEI